jgi:hypothetical protein
MGAGGEQAGQYNSDLMTAAWAVLRP